MLKQATRSFPMEAHADGEGFFSRPSQTTPYRTSGIRNTMPMFRQFTGLTPVEERLDIQKELDRFRLDYFEVAPVKIKDNIGNREARQKVAQGMEYHMTNLINSPEYNGLESDYEKEKLLRLNLQSLRTASVKDVLVAKDYDTITDVIRKQKARFFRLRKMDREIIIAKFKRMYPDVEIENDDYGMLYQVGIDYGILAN
tara:strand:- start:53 stop:649 length:597 start_codon:yes stop_codon:yes gene_type:complete